MDETSSHPDRAFALERDHVVDGQLVRATDVRQCEADGRTVRERILALETQAMTLLRAGAANPDAVAARRSLAALDTELARLRADLAWHRAEARTA